MRLPEPLFAIINPVVKTLLRSPIHGFWSKSLMLITFSGSRSGRRFTTPVRYVRVGDAVRCFTSAENMWCSWAHPARIRRHAPFRQRVCILRPYETRV